MELRDMTETQLREEFFKASDAYFDMIGHINLFQLIDCPAFRAAKLRLLDAANEMSRRKKLK